MVLINIPVRQNNDIGSVLMGPVHFQKQPVNGLFKGRILIICNRDLLHLKTGLLHILYLQKIRLRKDGVFHL